MAATSTTTSQVRIVARIRPAIGSEGDDKMVVKAEGNAVSMPNPKNEKETFTFPFHAVYGTESDQASIFSEVSPTLKHLFKGNDVTIFAYGVTGSGKTHTMRGGQRIAAERGIIPRLLTAIYRRGKDMEKKSHGETTMSAIMSYYEIYNDKVYDLFEAPEKRTLGGLTLREQNGKTHVVGLTETEITTLKEFETLYDKANSNRSTSATKLNAHSSRSHAIICVRVEVRNHASGDVKVGTVSCIDLAGSEDNRRTANDKERMVESASINKSLFVLSQCVEAMTKKQNRIPYRESKMTRILSLGQNNGMTVMILNLAPTKKFHQDTLSALNFANRAKTIEVKNDPQPVPQPITRPHMSTISGAPVRSFGIAKTNVNQNHRLSNTMNEKKPAAKDVKKPSKATPRIPLATRPLGAHGGGGIKKGGRFSDPSKVRNPKEREMEIEDLVEKKVEQILAARALNETSLARAPAPVPANDDVNRRLEQLEKLLEKKADARTEGLTYIVLAKQHVEKGETLAGLKMYQLALEYFPDNKRLQKRIADLEEKRKNQFHHSSPPMNYGLETGGVVPPKQKPKKQFSVFMDAETPPRPIKRARSLSTGSFTVQQSPRTKQLLQIINSEDVEQIMKLKGVGKKRAEALAQHVKELRERNDDFPAIKDLEDLGIIKGIGSSMVDKMRNGIAA